MEIRELRLGEIVPARNLRSETSVNIEELIDSIREHGLLQPIRVRRLKSGMYQIIAGHRRYLAHQRLKRDSINAVIVEESDEAAAVQGIVENLQREDLAPVELAAGVRELTTAFQMDMDAIARAISKSPAQVRTWIKIARLPEDVLGKLESGEGRTHEVTGLTPRLVQPFVSDMPSEEQVQRDPSAAAKFDEAVVRVTRFQEEVEKRGARLNAHMADEVARVTKSGRMTVSEAVDAVLAHPEKYRYVKPSLASAEELESDTWSAYRRIHQDLMTQAHKLRPEIAGAFSLPQQEDLLDRLTHLLESLRPYGEALSGARPEAYSVVRALVGSSTQESRDAVK